MWFESVKKRNLARATVWHGYIRNTISKVFFYNMIFYCLDIWLICWKHAFVRASWYEEEGEGTFGLFSFPFAFLFLSSFKSLLPPLTFVLSEDKTVALPPSVPCPVPPHHGCGNHSCVSKTWSGHQTLCPTSCLCSRWSLCTDRK